MTEFPRKNEKKIPSSVIIWDEVWRAEFLSAGRHNATLRLCFVVSREETLGKFTTCFDIVNGILHFIPARFSKFCILFRHPADFTNKFRHFYKLSGTLLVRTLFGPGLSGPGFGVSLYMYALHSWPARYLIDRPDICIWPVRTVSDIESS